MVRRRVFTNKQAHYRKLECTQSLTSFDYCLMVCDMDLPLDEITERLEVSERIVERMKKRDYMPRDKALQERILKLYKEI